MSKAGHGGRSPRGAGGSPVGRRSAEPEAPLEGQRETAPLWAGRRGLQGPDPDLDAAGPHPCLFVRSAADEWSGRPRIGRAVFQSQWDLDSTAGHGRNLCNDGRATAVQGPHGRAARWGLIDCVVRPYGCEGWCIGALGRTDGCPTGPSWAELSESPAFLFRFRPLQVHTVRANDSSYPCNCIKQACISSNGCLQMYSSQRVEQLVKMYFESPRAYKRTIPCSENMALK